MKHLKGYKIFEHNYTSYGSNIRNEVLDLYLDFIDTFDLTSMGGNKNWYSNNRIEFGIDTSKIRFGQGIKISIQSANYNQGICKDGPYKGFGGLPSDIAVELEKAHNRCLEHFGFKDYIVGSHYRYQSGGFSIVYYTEPNFIFEGKEFNPEHLYGEDAYVVKLEKGYLLNKSSHENIFHYYDERGNIDGMFCLWGGKDDMNYYNPIAITSGRDCDKYGFCIANSPVEQWVTKHWSDMCVKYRISVSKRAWSISRKQKDGDPTVYEFMDYLSNHQDDFNNYKSLPKVNKDRY